MSIKVLMKGGLGSFSRRSFEFNSHHHRSRSMSSVLDENQARRNDCADLSQQSCWATMPPELLRDIIQRVEGSESTWPSRKSFVACACVCRNWRSIAKELVKTPEASGKITFPISLKQPGPRDATIQCYIKRDRNTSTYLLYLGLTATLAEQGKFLLAARKVRRATSSDYIISLNAENMSRGSNTYVGKLRSNFLGTKFIIYDSQPPHNGAMASTSRAGRRVGSKQVSPRLAGGSYNVASIAYELNVLGTRGPRRMHCSMDTIPASALDPGGSAPTPLEISNTPSSSSSSYSFLSLPYFGSKSSVSDFSLLGPAEQALDAQAPRCSSARACPTPPLLFKEGPLILRNKAPRWHEQLQCWCLNFRGRVTVASVKNFQLVAANTPPPISPGHANDNNNPLPRTDPPPQPPANNPSSSSQSDHEKVLLQFGKIGKDTFTMDYRYPLSAFQAFAICLSSFDTKLACE